MTLLLTRSEIAKLVEPHTLAPMLESAFRASSAHPERKGQRVYSSLPGPGTATVVVPGVTPDIPAYSVKVHSKYPDSPPGIKGVLLLHDLENGRLLAVMDSTYITSVRTGLCAALATHRLARKDAKDVAVIGAGVQGEFQLRFLAQLRHINRVWVFDKAPEQSMRLVARIESEFGLAAAPCESVAEAAGHGEIILVATWATEPILLAHMVRPGSHVTTLGADQPGEAEVDAKLIRQSLFVCDDRTLAVEQGAVGGAHLGPDAIDAEFGEVIAGTHTGRTSDDQITVYGAVGLAFQDLVTGWQAYRSALKNAAGRKFDFLA